MALSPAVLLVCLALASSAASSSPAAQLQLSVDCSSTVPLTHFWRSVGYTPATYALRPDELENTAHIGAVPNRGVSQVRVHYFFDLITVLGWAPSASTPSGYMVSYDWHMLDYALDWLVANNLSPGFVR